ncbi:MAG: acyl carrier protein [Chitinispirillaceae bacterium]|nr:acyl carrier protein [Chitinispirillaceae bacterium]
MENTGIRERLLSILENEYNINPGDIDPDRPIFEQLPLDSMQLVAIAANIEETFGIELPLTFMEKPSLSHLIKLVTDAVERGKPPEYDLAH